MQALTTNDLWPIQHYDGVRDEFRKKIDGDDVATIKRFIARYRAPVGFVVTRDTWFEDGPVLALPLADFLLGF